MQLSPQALIWIKVVYALAVGISTGGLSIAGMVDPATAVKIVAWAGALGFTLSTVLTAFSSSAPGPLAPADPPVVVAATKVAELPPNAGPVQVAATKAFANEAVADHQP